jgi:hypothetical protein
MSIAGWPVLTGAGRQKCGCAYERSADRQSFAFTFEKPVSGLSVRLGPLPEGRTVSRAAVDGREVKAETGTSGDSRWVWVRNLKGGSGAVTIDLAQKNDKKQGVN